MSEATRHERVIDLLSELRSRADGHERKGNLSFASTLRDAADELERLRAAQVVPQPNREARAKWLFEFRFPDHKGYWDAGHTPERTKSQFREKADELAALSPAPLTIDREALAQYFANRRIHGVALCPNEYDYDDADNLTTFLSARPVEGEVDQGVRSSSGHTARWSEAVARTLQAGAVRGGHESKLVRRTVGPWIEVQP